MYKQSREKTRDGHTTNALLSTSLSCHVMSRHVFISCYLLKCFSSCHVYVTSCTNYVSSVSNVNFTKTKNNESRPVESCHVMSRHVTSFHIMEHASGIVFHQCRPHVMSSFASSLSCYLMSSCMSRHATSIEVMPRHVTVIVTSCHVMGTSWTTPPCQVTSCHVLPLMSQSCHVHVTSRPHHDVPLDVRRHVMSRLMSRPATSCHVHQVHAHVSSWWRSRLGERSPASMSRHMSRLVTCLSRACHVVSRHGDITSCHVSGRSHVYRCFQFVPSMPNAHCQHEGCQIVHRRQKLMSENVNAGPLD